MGLDWLYNTEHKSYVVILTRNSPLRGYCPLSRGASRRHVLAALLAGSRRVCILTTPTPLATWGSILVNTLNQYLLFLHNVNMIGITYCPELYLRILTELWEGHHHYHQCCHQCYCCWNCCYCYCHQNYWNRCYRCASIYKLLL